jgi:hypothetical protein
MAEKLKDWQSTVIWVIGLVFICGMTYKTVSGMDSRVTINTKKIDKNTDLIHKEEVQRMAMQGDIKSTRDDVSDMKSDVRKLTEYLMQYDFDKKGK